MDSSGDGAGAAVASYITQGIHRRAELAKLRSEKIKCPRCYEVVAEGHYWHARAGTRSAAAAHKGGHRG